LLLAILDPICKNRRRGKEETMFKTGLAAIVVTAIATMVLTAPADAQSRKYRDGGDYYRSGAAYGSASQQYMSGEKRGRPDPTSYDGRRTGQPRTCGHDFFIYSGRATAGPYCN
jgi:hypothetical protein